MYQFQERKNTISAIKCRVCNLIYSRMRKRLETIWYALIAFILASFTYLIIDYQKTVFSSGRFLLNVVSFIVTKAIIMSISCAFSKARLNCFGWLIFLLILYKYPNFLNLVPSMGYFSPWRHILSSSHWVKCYKLHINCRWLLFPIFKTLVEIHTLTFVRTPCNWHRASLTSASRFVFNWSRVRKFPTNDNNIRFGYI